MAVTTPDTGFEIEQSAPDKRPAHRQEGWLSAALPSVLIDSTTAGDFKKFVDAIEAVAETLLEQVDQFPELFDPKTARPEWLPWLASWVGEDIAMYTNDTEHLRHLIAVLQTNMSQRGTVGWYRRVVGALSDAEVEIDESPAIYWSGGSLEPASVTFRISGQPRMPQEQLRSWLDNNLPVGLAYSLEIT